MIQVSEIPINTYGESSISVPQAGVVLGVAVTPSGSPVAIVLGDTNVFPWEYHTLFCVTAGQPMPAYTGQQPVYVGSLNVDGCLRHFFGRRMT